MEGQQFFGRYQVRRLLGQGGFAMVYLARDPALQRDIAVKVLHPELASDPGLAARFLSEARQLAGLRHPRIIGVHDVGEQGGRPYFTMDFESGRTLQELLGTRGRLTLTEVANLALQLGDALDYLHQRGIIHRDLKPSNVMIGAEQRLTLMDFGVARALDQTQHTRAGAVLGTPQYMAPEQVRGQPVGPPADVYAFGVLLYYCLAGKPPFEGDTLAIMHQQVAELPPPLARQCPGLPAAVYAALDGALAKSPSDRPARALELATSIARAAGVPEPTLTASGTFKTIPGTGRERPVQNRGAFASANGPNSDHSTPTGAPSRTPYLLAGGGGLLLAMLIIILAIAYGTRGGGSTAAATPAGSLGTAVAAVVPTATVGAVSALAATVPPPTPPPTVVPQTPPPAPVVPPGDYRRVQNTGTDRCLRGRAQPTTNAPIWVCAVDQFVVRIIDGPRRADGYDWYNAEGIGWMAGDDLRGGLFLGSTGVPSPPALQFGCLDLAFRVTTDGNFRPPAVLHSELAFKGAQFEAADGTFAGWLFGDQLFLKYRATVGGREGTGTVVASVTGTTVRGQFVATSFSAGSGAVGTVNGIATPICGYGD